MPIVEFTDPGQYDKAVAMLLRMGAGIEARGERSLVVTPSQKEALADAGIKDVSQTNGSPREKTKA